MSTKRPAVSRAVVCWGPLRTAFTRSSAPTLSGCDFFRVAGTGTWLVRRRLKILNFGLVFKMCANVLEVFLPNFRSRFTSQFVPSMFVVFVEDGAVVGDYMSSII